LYLSGQAMQEDKSVALASLFEVYREIGDQPAILMESSDAVSYNALFDRVSSFARAINNLSREGPCRIAINSAKCVDAYAVELASVAVGGVFCPLNVDAPRGRNDQILRDFVPDVIFSGPGGIAALHNSLAGVADLVPALSQDPVIIREWNLEDCAYVIYTSGTSGYPKGVQVTYRNLEWFLSRVLDRLAVPAAARWSNHPNLAFDLSILDLFGAVASGSTLVPLKSPIDRAFPARVISELQLGVWHSVPSVVESLQRVRAGEAGMLKSLERVILCGEPCRRSWVEYLLEHCAPSARIYNAYGPTETTVFCVMEEMTRGYAFNEAEFDAPLGTPFKGVSIQSVDHSAEFELIIASPGVGIGYVNVPNGEHNGYFVDSNGSRLYRTGDLAQEIDGKLYYRGRIDNQVKLRGYRFELSEIEGILGSVGVVGGYAVVVRNSVVLFLDANCQWSDERILVNLSEHLPSYAIPKRIIRVNDFPRNVNDKVDRRELTRQAEKHHEVREYP
jgi:D-alanine--poly(phosphoribitol) ligase subunit 1